MLPGPFHRYDVEPWVDVDTQGRSVQTGERLWCYRCHYAWHDAWLEPRRLRDFPRDAATALNEDVTRIVLTFLYGIHPGSTHHWATRQAARWVLTTRRYNFGVSPFKALEEWPYIPDEDVPLRHLLLLRGRIMVCQSAQPGPARDWLIDYFLKFLV